MKKIISLTISCLIFFITAARAENINLSLNSKAVFLTEAETGEILYKSNESERLPIASVTKIMTMLLICEALDSGKISLEDMVPVSERAMSMGGSTMFLEAGEQLSVSDMLKGIAVASANDGCVAMAEFLDGSVEGFVDRMNSRASELGMKNTNFVNTNGLDADNHYSSAEDVAIMSAELLKHKVIFNYTTIWTDTLRNGKFELANTNKLIRFYDGATGLKTGSTSKALCCISATAKRNDMHLIAVVLGAPDSKTRFSDAKTLLNYGFSSYSLKKYITHDEPLEEIPVSKGKTDTLPVYVKNEISALIPRGTNDEYEKEIKLHKSLKAPISAGSCVGEIIISKNGTEIGRTDLCAGANIEKKSFFEVFCGICKKLFI